MCKGAVSGYRAFGWREGKEVVGKTRLDGGNLACETVGIGKQETAG